MRTWVVLAAGALIAGAIAIWRLQGPALKSCTVQRATSASSPNDRYVAHVEVRTCDEGLKSGLFVVVEKSIEPGTLHEAFYSSRPLRNVAIRWSDYRELEIVFPEPLDSNERQYGGQTVADSVAVRLKEVGEERGLP
jgi:hypothetical protein